MANSSPLIHHFLACVPRGGNQHAAPLDNQEAFDDEAVKNWIVKLKDCDKSEAAID